MKNFTPKAWQARKYSDYTVEIRKGKAPVWVAETDGFVVRYCLEVRRVPSTKTFIAYIKTNASPDEERRAIETANKLPAGWWALHEDRWFRRKARNGQIYFRQSLGWCPEDPLVQLELEMMIDLAQQRVAGPAQALRGGSME